MASLLSYYRPGLDVSKLNDEQFITEVAHLLLIRKMEQSDQVNKVLNNFFKQQNDQ